MAITDEEHAFVDFQNKGHRKKVLNKVHKESVYVYIVAYKKSTSSVCMAVLLLKTKITMESVHACTVASNKGHKGPCACLC